MTAVLTSKNQRRLKHLKELERGNEIFAALVGMSRNCNWEPEPFCYWAAHLLYERAGAPSISFPAKGVGLDPEEIKYLEERGVRLL